MSQQDPGQPPGAGGPPQGYGGAPPAAYGHQIPQGGAPPGVGVAQPPKSNRALLVVGLGCGLFLLIAAGAVAIGVFWLRAKTNSAISDLEQLRPVASAVVASTEASSGAARVLSGDCLAAYQCCRGIAAKSTSSAAAVAACELFKTAGYPASTCAVALTGYRKTAELVGVRCD